MEAAVLKRQLMPEMESQTAELEVKKLQELVRKLERQNEQLRSRTNGCRPHLLSPPAGAFLPHTADYYLPGPLATPTCQSTPDEPPEYFNPHTEREGEFEESTVLDQLEDLDLDSLFPAEESEETWLYVSSRARLYEDGPLTSLQWCRHVLDGSESEMESVQRSLSLRLDQVSRWHRPTSSPSSSTPPLSSWVVGVSSCSTPSSPLPGRLASSLSSPIPPLLQRTRSSAGKEVPPPSDHSRLVLRSVVQSSMDGDSIALGYKLQDLTDVQVMARMQEESLRQDYAGTSSILANRRSHSYTFQLNPLSPALDEGLLQPRLTFSTPPYSSGGFASQPLDRPTSDKLRRSMPNLVRAPSVPIPTGHSASPSLLRNSQSFDSSSGLACLQSFIPSPGRVQSVGNFASSSRQPLKATAYVSPTIKGSVSMPTSINHLRTTSSNSGIPLLNKTTPPRSKIAQPVHSLLTPPKSMSTLSALRDTDWKNGCY
ncbi:SLAIN motif-containing protein 1-like isoform X2 [Lampris incognitus]|uniref:SLAIN motif-containing protein 1-like isoform X2 n=1 Tax=Lampris incognitus TaxID=2546036 RepID=UPI0024B5461C|nr:SLAIN motif-containing protein 1-like isoform X2 [Lampris incognitus]